MPAYLAARSRHIPVVVHEQNAVPGLANRVAARFAAGVYTAFPDTPLPGAEFIGMPLRANVAELASLDERDRAERRRRTRKEFGLDEDRPTLLVSGGSQGAVSVNTAVVHARGQLLADGVQVLHVLGPRNMAGALTHTDDSTGARWVPVAYVDDMARAYAAADLMVARSGAGTVVETAVCGLPTIYVPLPHGNGEQARNASSVVAAGGGVLIRDDELNATRLMREVARIHHPDELARMSMAGRDLMSTQAAQNLAQAVVSAATRRKKK